MNEIEHLLKMHAAAVQSLGPVYRIKPLEWYGPFGDIASGMVWQASTFLGMFEVWDISDSDQLRPVFIPRGAGKSWYGENADSLESAKATAQSHHQALMREGLEVVE